jgi:hypothetical protein
MQKHIVQKSPSCKEAKIDQVEEAFVRAETAILVAEAADRDAEAARRIAAAALEDARFLVEKPSTSARLSERAIATGPKDTA